MIVPLRSLVPLAMLVVISFMPATAQAFDPYPWAGDHIDTCFQNTNLAWTTTRMNQATFATEAWEDQIPGLVIDHNTDPATCSSTFDEEMAWVDHLDGDLGSSYTTLTGVNRIEFAEHYSSGGNLIPWSYDASPGASQYDFRSTVQHELGHALGLHHPEFENTYPYKSFDGQFPVMRFGGALPGTLDRRTFKQDDVAGGSWIVEREWVPLPGMADPQFWHAINGTKSDCGSYTCLSKSGTNVPYMYTSLRFTMDNRADRRTPTLTVKWRESGLDGGLSMRPRIKYHSVGSDGTLGSDVFVWGTECFDNHSDATWETCTSSLTLGIYNVADITLYLYNYTDGAIDVDDVRAVDG